MSGPQRDQIVMVDLTSTPDSVSDWATTRFQQQCAAVFDTYMHDVDIGPDGSYFVIATTGAYRAGSLCDTASRWELGRTGSGQPTWVDDTGGDVLYSVAIAAPGPRNGLPLLWNPGRDRGVGVFALVSTAEGLWIGSDADRIGRYEYHGKLSRSCRSPAAAPSPSRGSTPCPASSTAWARPASWTTAPTTGRLRRARPGPRGWTGPGPRRLHGQRQALHRLVGQQPVRPRLRRRHRGPGHGAQPGRGEHRHQLPGQPRHRHVPRALQRPPPRHPERRRPAAVPLLQPEGGVVGAETFTASAPGWSSVSGMTLASGTLYVATSNGNLSAVDFAGGVPSGSAAVISGPAVDGQSWQSRGLFALAT